MADLSQTDRLMRIDTVAGKDVLVIESLEGTESISRLFEFHVELLAEADTTVDPTELVGSKATVTLNLGAKQGGVRYFNGIITSFEQGPGDKEFNAYHATIRPGLWQLTLGANTRVFQNATALDVVKQVIGAYGLTISDQTKGKYPQLEYCTQYSETDFYFISRLMQEHGISYWFEHTDSDNKIVLADDTSAYQECKESSLIKYKIGDTGADAAYQAWVSEFYQTAAMVTGKHSTSDYGWGPYQRTDAGDLASSSTYGKNAYDSYLYPAGSEGYVKTNDQISKQSLPTQTHMSLENLFLKTRQLTSDAVTETYRGEGNVRSFTPGYTFALTVHPNSNLNKSYLLTSLTHAVMQAPPYRSSDERPGDGYSNRFLGVLATVVYKAPAVYVKPRILGPQTAKVIVASGEEIEVDKYGRVNVQFWWDKVRAANTVDNTWVRVAQQWAGNGRGAYFWPRGGDEVIVDFLNGDPDNPIITGSVYNGVNVPKYPLPDNSTRSGWVTRSSKGGTAANANELRLEDKKGSEQIFLNAEKDMDHRVENDLRLYVGGQDSTIVVKDQLDTIQGDRHSEVQGNLFSKIDTNANVQIGGNLVEAITGNADVAVTGNLTAKTADSNIHVANLTIKTDSNTNLGVGGMFNESVGGNKSVNVTGNYAEQASGNYALQAMEIYLNANATVVLQASMGITLAAGGGFITIGPTGVMISGTMVLINSGGAALSGTPGTVMAPQSPPDPQKPTDPKTPDTADDGTKGTMLKAGSDAGS
jgi:type VI secretion system secreted protein VgrG